MLSGQLSFFPGFFYSKAVAAHGFVEPCVGHDCYGPTFVVEAVMCLLGCVAAAVVMVTTRGVYELLSAHLHEVEEEEQQDMIEQVGPPKWCEAQQKPHDLLRFSTTLGRGQGGELQRTVGCCLR